MGTEPLNYWYDQQLRRIMLQFTRVFSNITYQYRDPKTGETRFKKVPCRYALNNRQVAHIIKNNSENTSLIIPMISCHIRDLRVARDRTQEPFHTEKHQINERPYLEEEGRFATVEDIERLDIDPIGGRYQLERYMPVPYNITAVADIITSNQMQKDQIAEQLLTLFNPSIDLQHSENLYDWGGLTILELTEVQYSSRSIPIGVESDIDIMSLTYEMPVWLSPPAKLTRQKLIHQIVTNIGELRYMEEMGVGEGYEIHYSPTDLIARIINSPGDHQLRVDGNELTLLGPNGSLHDENGNVWSWEELIDRFSNYREGISQIRIKTAGDIEDFDSDVVGTFEFNVSEPNKLTWNIEYLTLPNNTLPAINGIIDPHETFPGSGLPSPVSGTRYIILSEIGPSEAWGNITAYANDIIEWNGTEWIRTFDSEFNKDITHYVQNLASGKQLKWVGDWVLAIDGEYNPGFWRIFL